MLMESEQEGGPYNQGQNQNVEADVPGKSQE